MIWLLRPICGIIGVENNVLSERCYQHPRTWIHLIRRRIMDSLSQNVLFSNLNQEVPLFKAMSATEAAALRKCPGCNKYLSLENFVKSKNAKNGHGTYCRSCCNEQNKKRRSKKPDKPDHKFRMSSDNTLLEKRCGICQQWKDVAEFGPNGSSLRWICKNCDAARKREDRKNKPTYQKDLFLQRVYGITLEDYNIMLVAQNGVCKACGCPETVLDVRTQTLRSLAVDHDHETGKIRGLLCQGCNQALGSLRENLEKAKSLVRYIEEVVLP